MSSDNVELLRRGFETFNRDGDVEAIIDLIDPGFEGVAVPELTVEPQTYRGPEGIRRYFDSFYEVMEEISFYPDEFIDAGDKVVVPVVLTAKGRGTGLAAEQPAVQVWTMRDGKAVKLDVFADREAALRAAGIGT